MAIPTDERIEAAPAAPVSLAEFAAALPLLELSQPGNLALIEGARTAALLFSAVPLLAVRTKRPVRDVWALPVEKAMPALAALMRGISTPAEAGRIMSVGAPALERVGAMLSAG